MQATSIPVSDSSVSSVQPELDHEAAKALSAATSGAESEGSHQELDVLLSSTPDVHIPLGPQPSDGPTMSPAAAAAAKSTVGTSAFTKTGCCVVFKAVLLWSSATSPTQASPLSVPA